jgi:hypothetical protein
MLFFEEVVLTDSVEIKTTPEKIFNFITSIVDDETYKAWHADDHLSFKWLRGEPWAEGSILFAEEYIHGKIHKFKFKVTQNIPNKKIKYSPISPLLKMFFPKNEFLIESKVDSCLFIASVTYRVGWLGKKTIQ